jgi:hypothetical protein
VPPSRRTTAAPPPLTDDDVAQLRAKVSAGERPRVVVRAASAAVAAGTRGNVVRMGDPKESEYIVVRLGKDEVPFAPAELGLTTRPKTAAAKPTTTPPPPAARTSAPAAPAAPTRKTAPRHPARPASVVRKPARAAKKLPPLVVTMRFRDGGWTVEGQRGARRLSKVTGLRPGAVSAFAEHLDEGSMRDALVEAVESCRNVVEQRAASLRAELEAAEAALRAYESRPTRTR